MKSIISLITFFLTFNVFGKELPAKFDNQLIYLIPTLDSGEEITFFTDTGGGFNAIAQDFHTKYKWPTITEKEGDETLLLTPMPNYKLNKGIPLGGLNNFMKGNLFLVNREEIDGKDGFLGGRWHAEKVIGFNYLNRTMAVYTEIQSLNIKPFTKIELGFQKDSSGNYTTAFPSIEITVENEIIPMLFDTGATAHLSNNAQKTLNTKAQKIGTSFISASTFERWRQSNPQWLVIENGDLLAGESMIQVPKLSIAGKTIGPVWFTRRQDHNFHSYMSSMMDRKIDGAIGGSLLKYLHVIVDYPNEVAYIKTN
ncbi:MAG: hypothetical protein VX100_21375 [Pseudomonadota bacterium]|nr:hypothetical protein [Pseudomonadota bacterium]